MSLLRRNNGDTLVEVVIALAILSLTLAVAYNVANLSFRAGVQARESTVAAELIQDQAEKLRALRDYNVAQDPTPQVPTNDVFGGANGFGSGLHYMDNNDRPVAGAVAEDAATCAASGLSPCSVNASVCEGLPTCLLRDDITQTTNANPLLNEITATITVSWTSLIGQTQNSSQLTYYLTDTRLISPCDNSVAGTCQ